MDRSGGPRFELWYCRPRCRLLAINRRRSGFEARRGGLDANLPGQLGCLHDGNAEAIEGLPLARFIGLVARGIAVAHADQPSAA